MAYVVIPTGRSTTGMVSTHTAVPSKVAVAFQNIVDQSKNKSKGLTFSHLCRSNRIQNGGSFPENLLGWAEDEDLPCSAFLQFTTHKRNDNDRGIVVVQLPMILRNVIPSYKQEPYLSMTNFQLVTNFNNSNSDYGIKVSPDLKFLSRQPGFDINKQVFTYRHDNFHPDGRDDVASMKRTHDDSDRTNFGKPDCKYPGCDRESTKRGHCSKHLPKVSVNVLFNLDTIFNYYILISFVILEMPFL